MVKRPILAAVWMGRGAVATLVALAACGGSDEQPREGAPADGGAGDAAPLDVAASDASRPDVSAQDAPSADAPAGDPPVDAADQSDTRDGSGGGGAWSEEFTTVAHLDLAQTTARHDPASGTVGTPARRLRAVSPEGAGALELDPVAPSLAPGVYWARSLDLSWTGELVVDGDLTLLIGGDARIGGALRVQGELTVAALGALLLDGGSLAATEGVRVHQHGAAPMILGELAYLSCEPVEPGAPAGGVEVLSRGDVVLEERAWIAASARGGISRNSGGPITIVGAESLRLGSGTFVDGGLGSGSVVWLGGDVEVGSSAFIYGGEVNDATVATWGPADTDIRAGGTIRILDRGQISGDTSSVQLRARDRIELGPSSEVLTNTGWSVDFPPRAATSLTVEAGSVVVEGGYLNGGGDWSPRESGPPMIVRSVDALRINGDVYGIDTGCGYAGPIVFETERDIEIGPNGSIRLASAYPRSGECSVPDNSGTATLRAGGSVTAEGREVLAAISARGGGEVGPLVTIEEAAAASVAPIELGFEGVDRVVSGPIEVSTGGRPVLAVDIETAVESALSPRLRISRDGGATWTEDVVGAPLEAGWRYELELPWELLDGPVVDRVTLRW